MKARNNEGRRARTYGWVTTNGGRPMARQTCRTGDRGRWIEGRKRGRGVQGYGWCKATMGPMPLSLRNYVVRCWMGAEALNIDDRRVVRRGRGGLLGFEIELRNREKGIRMLTRRPSNFGFLRVDVWVEETGTSR
jgi:hypothetical protein